MALSIAATQPFGVGVGGSTNLYAAALERFDDRDIDSHPDSPHPTGGWPISYDDLLPYYEKAERMLHVCGTSDPLNPTCLQPYFRTTATRTAVMRIFCNSSKKAACILIDFTSASAIGRAAMNALADCATKTAGRTCVLCLLSPKTSRRSWHAVR